MSSHITDETERVCREVRKNTDTCVLAFSGGKDSLATLTVVREFFPRVIPYYLVTYPTNPGLTIVERQLKYCEKVFGLEIVRIRNGLLAFLLETLVFQHLYDQDRIKELGLKNYTHLAPFKLIKKKFDCPDAWLCTGSRSQDSVLQRRKLDRNRGVVYKDTSFYPIYDWSINQVIDCLKKFKLYLPLEYQVYHRNFFDAPLATELVWIKENFPEDLEKIKQVLPLVEAQLARNEFRKMHWDTKLVTGKRTVRHSLGGGCLIGETIEYSEIKDV